MSGMTNHRRLRSRGRAFAGDGRVGPAEGPEERRHRERAPCARALRFRPGRLPPAYTAPAMTIGIMGLGYVGLPLAVAFAEEGCDVIALDTDVGKIEAIRRRESYIEDIPSERLAAVADRIEATTHAQPLARCDAALICVPTPL